MKKLNKNKAVWLFLMILLGPLMGHAVIYKWVDANGTTHYSEQNPAKNNVTTLKVEPPPPSVKTPEELFQAKEKARRAKIEKESAQASKVKKPVKKKGPPKSVSGGREDGTDQSRCALARDILNGSLGHGPGIPLDAYDIKVATRDVKKFCH